MDLARTGVFRSMVPHEIGGLETSPAELLETIEEIARHHGSTAWCVMIGSTTALLSGYLPRPESEVIYGTDADVITGGAYAPTGRAIVGEDGSLTVTGRWEWGSGSSNCSWLLGGALLVDDAGDLIIGDDGRPQARLCFAPAADVQIEPNWDVLGMRGTGSNDLVMDAVAVPQARAVSLFDQPWPQGPLWRFPPFGLLALGIAAVSLGVARSAMEATVELAGPGARTGKGVGSSLRAEVARCEGLLRAARALLYDEVAHAWDAACNGETFDLPQRAALRLAATHAATTSAEVCTRLHLIAGGAAVRHGNALERTVRDALTATQHILVGPKVWDAVGACCWVPSPGSPSCERPGRAAPGG